MSARVLCVDDEPRILEGFDLHLGMEHDLFTAESGEAGLAVLEAEGPFDVVVSDMRMPGMDGAQFLKHVRERSPTTQRVLLTGHADLEAALRAINEGGIFRFLTKPCDCDLLLRTVEEAAEIRRLKRAERDLLERTVRGCVEMLAEVMGVTSPAAFGRAERIRLLAKRLCAWDAVDPDAHWLIEVAALTSRLGTIAVPHEVLELKAGGAKLTEDQKALVARIPETGAMLLEKVPRLEGAADLVRRAHADSSLSPKGSLAEPSLTVLRVAIKADDALSSGKAWADIVRTIDHSAGHALGTLLGREPRTGGAEPQALPVSKLAAGMELLSDVRTLEGQCVVKSGTRLTHPLVLRLHSFAQNVGIEEPITVSDAA